MDGEQFVDSSMKIPDQIGGAIVLGVDRGQVGFAGGLAQRASEEMRSLESAGTGFVHGGQQALQRIFQVRELGGAMLQIGDHGMHCWLELLVQDGIVQLARLELLAAVLAVQRRGDCGMRGGGIVFCGEHGLSLGGADSGPCSDVS